MFIEVQTQSKKRKMKTKHKLNYTKENISLESPQYPYDLGPDLDQELDIHLADVHVNSNSNEKYGNEAEVDDRVNEYRYPTSMKVAKLNYSGLPRELEDEPWRQEDEQNECDEHWSPVRHLG